ncbi:N-6 DNA methylase [Lignipirellula cremea]|uniref:site-specific DNA-methyltransferase (adenine-specific) n=1 Tax=Lignipirellula cremea TaxID=2528010 RepID=A0A518DQK6_9BACT|nr:N-6 DNA methylase [Lignipirellula cremea]QDU94102.1 Type I restriction enzyme R protein [Lignipirellula cremea]
MKLKPTILAIFRRDDLKGILDDLGLEGVDRRSVDAMRGKLSRSRSVTAEDLLAWLRKPELQTVCGELGLQTKGKRDELVERILNGSNSTVAATSTRRKMNQDVQQTLDLNGNTKAPPKKKPEKLTLARLERRLFEACDILRGNMDASEFKEYIFGMLFLKRLSDQFDADRESERRKMEKKGIRADLIEKQLDNPDKFDFFVPAKAHWDKIKHLKQSVGSGLNKALAAIEDGNPNTLQDVLKGINFNRKVGQRTMDDSTLIEFIQHFDELPLSNDDFEFPDLLGAAYEYLIKYFADSAGKKGGEFYTPAEVVRTMVHLIEPKEGMACYDPCVGSGGMLIQSKHYVQESGGDPRNLSLSGQELNGGTWAVCKMNMILHGKSDGKMAVVMPHGVLFRGGDEKECRKRFIRDGVLEAVIGLPPGLFYGTGIPASVLVINKQGAAQRTSVLFINADREYKEGKNQNSLRPEDTEKITHVYHKHLDVCDDLKDLKVCLVNDRKDLEEQLGKTAQLTDEKVTYISSTDALRSKLSKDSSNLNMVMVHKFQEGQDEHVPDYLESALEIPRFENFGIVNPSERILLMIDEAHRTQAGDLGDNLFEAFPNATRLAFTGTPLIVVKDKKKTVDRFGKYIDKYKLQDAVDDGATVQILYEGKTPDSAIDRKHEFDTKVDELAKKHVESQMRKAENVETLRKIAKRDEKPFDDLVKERTAEEILALKKKWGTTGDILEADERIEAIAANLVDHYLENILPNGFKAQVVCSSKMAAIKYKKFIDKALATRLAEEQAKPVWSGDPAALPEADRDQYRDDELCQRVGFLKSVVVVSSEGTNEPAAITDSRKHAREVDAVENFKRAFNFDDPEKVNTGIAFLIVCDMLLTGFDAPVEQVMYIDKKVTNHNLLQTIARVNRVAKGKSRGQGFKASTSCV